VDHFHDVPVLELLQAVADVRPGDAEGLADVLRVERLGCDEEERMDLGNGAVDPLRLGIVFSFLLRQN
jgi:hypothetical protein